MDVKKLIFQVESLKSLLDMDAVLKVMEKAMENQTVETYEQNVGRLFGEEVWVSINFHGCKDEMKQQTKGSEK